jgi:hypothetical protein
MAFKADIKTETRSHGGDEDKKSPDWKRLNASAINEKSALAGVSSCTDGKLIHGDLRELIYQHRQTDILQDDQLTIQGKRTQDIEKTSQLTVKQGRDTMIGVYDKTQVQGERQLWVDGVDHEFYATHREIEEPQEKFERKHFCWEYGVFGIDTQLSAFETKALGLAVENVKIEAKMFEQTNHLIAGKMDAITSKAEGMDLSLGFLLLRIKYALNALPNFAASTPIS